MNKFNINLLFVCSLVLCAPVGAEQTEDLKPLAKSVLQETDTLLKQAGGIRRAANPYKTARNLQIKIADLRKKAAPLGNVITRPYGRCGVLPAHLANYVSAITSPDNQLTFDIDMFYTAKHDCELLMLKDDMADEKRVMTDVTGNK